MSRDIKYIGMDVHQEAVVLAVLNSSGKLVMESIVETKASSILQFIQGLRGELHVTWEEGTWAAWLYDLLQPQVARVLVCDPPLFECFLRPPAATGCPIAVTPTSTSACLIDWVLANATVPAAPKSGYYFGYGVIAAGGLNLGYTVGSIPAALNTTGVRGFCSNEDGVIRFTAVGNTAPVVTNAACAAYTNLQ